MARYKTDNSRRRRFKNLSILLVAMVVIFMGAVLGVRHWYQSNLQPVNPSSQKTIAVTISEGTTLRQTANLLAKQKIIKNSWVFEQYVNNKNAAEDIKAGTYDLSQSYNVSQIVSILTAGKVATNLITILPGLRLDQIKKTFISAGFNQSVIDQAFNPDMYSNHPALVDKPAGASLEGYLYPESFERTADTQATTIIRQSLDEMQQHLTPSLRAMFAQEGLSVYQGITLASIVEQEVSTSSDRAQVAQVFLTRLQSGMMLGSDVTAVYGSIINNQPPTLSYDSPYNTLLHPGLPPGPISNVTDSSLQAVAHPANTNWLYFVSGDNGITYFSQTFAEHQTQINTYCHKLCNLIPN